jgi:hypothetical protein
MGFPDRLGLIGRALLIGLVTTLILAGPDAAQTTAPAPASRLSGWAATVIAADWRTSHGRPIQAFDNARRDVVAGLLAAGFDRANVYDATLRPDVASPVSATEALAGMTEVTGKATRGCLIYFTSHGSPDRMVFGPDSHLTPTSMATMVRQLCRERPTVVVVSACFSGIFVDALSGPDRMVITAARRDRSSFGCSEDATYPYFDGCVIEGLATASDFIALANAARACVKRREQAEDLSPGSEPQVSIGANMQLLLPTLRFNPRLRPPEASSGS